MNHRKKRPGKWYKNIPETAAISWRLLKLVWSIDRVLFTFSILATIIPGIMPFITAYIGKLLIDFVVSYIAGKPVQFGELYVLLGLGLAVYFLQNVAFRTQEYVESLLWTKIPITINQLIFQKTSTLDMQYFEDSSFKDLLNKVRESYNYRTQNLISNILFLLQSIVQLSIATIALIHLNWILLLIIILVAIPEFVNEARQSKLAYGIWDANTRHRKRFWYLTDILQTASSVKEIKLFSLNKSFLKEVKDIQTKFYEDNAKLAKRTYFINLGLNAVSTIFLIGVQLFVIIQALSKKITIGDINFYQSVISNFQNGLSGFFSNINRIFDHSQYVKSIFDLFDAKPYILEADNPVKLTLTKPPTIEFRNVSFQYPGKKEYSLRNFSLTIRPGEKVAFVGENGAGKSTIIKLLARFYDVTEGEILVNGINLKELSFESWYKQLGILFQDFNHYEDSVKENIGYGDIDKPKEHVIPAAKASGAESFIKSFDKAYDQMLGTMFEEGKELSTGQWQKIALARAFFRDAKVLILDEPTAAIDAKAEAEIFDRVDKLSKDRTVIIISHRFSTVRNADTIYVIENGTIKESGSHEKLMKEKGQYEKLFTLQAKRYQ